MNKRVRELRKALGMTLEKFGGKIGLKKSSLSQIENGINALTDSNIKSICREFNVNESWLMDGTGEMFVDISRDEEIAEFVGRTLAHESETFKKDFISMLSRLDESDWKVLEKMALELSEMDNKKETD